MKRYIYIFFSALFVLTGYFSIERLFEKPDLPFDYSSGIFTYSNDSVKNNYRILSVSGIAANNDFQMEFIIDSRKIGDRVEISYKKESGEILSSGVILEKYYHASSFVIITSIVGYVFLIMGLFVVLKKTDTRQALFLYWILSLYGIATLTSPGHFTINGDTMGYIIRTLHAVSYPAGGLFFVLFILSFPVERLKNRKLIVVIFVILTSLTILFSAPAQIMAINSIKFISLFETSWNIVKALLVISMLYGAIELYLISRTLKQKEERRKTEWIIWGLTVGVSPYIILWVIPDLLKLSLHIREEYLLAFLIFVPISFVIAVLKYHVLDIEVVVKRSFVYTLLTLCIFGIYSALIYISSKLFSMIINSELELLNLVAVLISALAFNPLRNRLNKFADKLFYREKFEFDKAVREILARMRECLSLGEFARTLISEIQKFIPVKSIAVIIRKDSGERVRILEHLNFDELSKNIHALRVNQLTSDFQLPLARETKVEKGIKIDNTMEKVLKRWNINTAIPIVLESGRPSGAIVLGDKLSGLKYSPYDFELLNAAASSAALSLKRIELQEKLVQEEIEMSRLEELNELKSFYVASVSHDLKTPLTSIKVFTELMQADNSLPLKKKNEFLQIIESETNRLTRLIDNVLNFAKIEKGIKQYSYSEIDLQELVNEVTESINYFIRMNKFSLEVEMKDSIPKISGDPDAIKTALFNIITNSVKYSKEYKFISIISGIQNNYAFVEISDKGIGIPESDQKMIFDPFFRSSSIEKNPVKGAGLGLAIVKHVMDAHDGKIELISKVNAGTKIRLLFPLKKNE